MIVHVYNLLERILDVSQQLTHPKRHSLYSNKDTCSKRHQQGTTLKNWDKQQIIHEQNNVPQAINMANDLYLEKKRQKNNRMQQMKIAKSFSLNRTYVHFFFNMPPNWLHITQKKRNIHFPHPITT